ncbi:DNA-3-methyladenine glycosylase family protein [Paenibacillus montanisoli]|uniref:DNA-3-methyladenine glycosylase II n=1 Tax=Paenibacillus montanisoli TaxID=2081970 RepID=A0A328UEE3_9BACL|nr:DNA-3-methyladenine glycosylase [Paenibacillus montanisoli]RAP78316.1 DNA-3-methyladenine glycosylase [Paenibacillus montanisoli]
MHAITLHPPAAFSSAAIIDYLKRSSNECLFHVEGNTVKRLIPTPEGPQLIWITPERDALRIAFPALHDAPSEELQAAAHRYVWEWFDCGRDLTPFYGLAEQDGLLRDVAKQFYGLRIVGIEDLFEAMSWGIMGQQINLAFAYTLKRRFVERYGSALDWDGRRYYSFPSPETIAELEPADLTALQFTGRKAEYMIGTAAEIAEGRLSKAQLLALNDWTAIEKTLTRIRGIGPWTANYVLMRCLRMPGAFPIEDVGLHNALKHVLKREDKPTIAEIKQLSSGWGDWKAYATFYLWRTLY